MKHTAMTKLKFLQLKNRLKLPTFQVVGVLESLWVFAATNAPDGGIGRFSDEGIAAFLEWQGSATELIAALSGTGWLDLRDDVHRLSIHDWHEHAPNYVKGALARHGKAFLAPPPGTTPKAPHSAIASGSPPHGTPLAGSQGNKAPKAKPSKGRKANDQLEGNSLLEQPAQSSLPKEPALATRPGMVPSNLTQPNLTQPSQLLPSEACPETLSASSGPPTPLAKPILEFPCDGANRTWALTDAQVDEWRHQYPSLNIVAECRKAQAWISANQNKRKTARGMPAFLVNWLNRATNSSARPALASQKAEQFAELSERVHAGLPPSPLAAELFAVRRRDHVSNSQIIHSGGLSNGKHD